MGRDLRSLVIAGSLILLFPRRSSVRGRVGDCSRARPAAPPRTASTERRIAADAARAARHRRTSAERRYSVTRFPDGDFTASGVTPPYWVANGAVHGYKVHLGDLPRAWAPNMVYAKIMAEVLGPLDIDVPDDANTTMPLSHDGGRQAIRTWVELADAVRARAALHDFVWEDGTRCNAKFWTPRSYNPWNDDERFEFLPNARR